MQDAVRQTFPSLGNPFGGLVSPCARVSIHSSYRNDDIRVLRNEEV